MPKEIIRTGSPDHVGPTVHVGWSPDQYVQLATVDPAHNDENPHGNGWYADLDRHAINRLIKVLRRARDAAYGRDE